MKLMIFSGYIKIYVSFISHRARICELNHVCREYAVMVWCWCFCLYLTTPLQFYRRMVLGFNSSTRHNFMSYFSNSISTLMNINL